MPEIDAAAIREAVRKKYAEVAQSAEGKFVYPTGRQGALALGYDPSVIKRLPDDVLASFCGVGNPFACGPIKQGEAILDVGCGAGVDMIVASRFVSTTGKVCGIDMTPDMAERARANLRRSGVTGAEVQVSGAESVPYPDASFDIVISNGVINLSPAKEEVFKEIYRVLRPGGRLQFADIVVNQTLPLEVANSLEAWSQWVGGAIPVRDQVELMGKAGFVRIEYLGTSNVTTSRFTVGALFRARKAQFM